MNTADLRTFPLYTVTNRRGEVAQWMPANVAFTASNRASADDCALALRHYDADSAWSNDITGEWTVTENREPFAVATFAKHATACDALRTLNAEIPAQCFLPEIEEVDYLVAVLIQGVVDCPAEVE
jgi:hypothetical protein